jgi:hypothetical protein
VFLGRVEELKVDVQTRAREGIDVPRSAPRALHSHIVDLFASDDQLRIVTTNFDRHFTTVVHGKHSHADVFIGPALPLGSDFSGLVYLHGAVQNRRSHLVLTDRDFGRAYLADGWATRFLIEMFRTYTVLFIGYSHEDPVMRYLARSFVGGVKRFALTVPEKADHWANLGITPVRFRLRPEPDEYGGIDDGIRQWVVRANMGAFDHKASIERLAANPPPIDPEEIDYLRSVFDDRVNLGFFIETAERPEWLSWAESEGLLACVVDAPTPTTTGARELLASWIARNFAVTHAKTAVDFVQRHSETLRPEVPDSIAFQLGYPGTEVNPETLKVWVAALLSVPSTPDHALMRLLRKAGQAGDIETTAFLFGILVQPKLELEERSRRLRVEDDDDPHLSLDAEVSLRGDHYSLDKTWREVLLPELALIHLWMLPLITTYLTQAHILLRTAGRADEEYDPMSQRRRAIEPHEQDRYSPEWGLLVDVARDTLDWVLANDAALASATMDSWRRASPRLLTRLSVYGQARRTDLSPDDRLALIQRHGWLYDRYLKHEVFDLLSHVFPSSGAGAQGSFIAYSMNFPEPVPDEDPDAARGRAYARYNVAVWLRRIAPDSALTREHFEALEQQHPGFAARAHPDLDVWISAGFRGPLSPKTREELVATAIEEVATLVLTFEPPPAIALDAPERPGLMTELQSAATDNVPWSLRLAALLTVREEWRADVWESLLLAWHKAPLDAETWATVLGLVEAHEKVAASSPRVAAQLLQRAIDRKELSLQEIERLEQLTLGLLPFSDLMEGGISHNGQRDWLTAAINHPGGVVAFSWIAALARRLEIAGDDWTGIPGVLRQRYESLLGGAGNNAPLAQTAFSSQLHFLYRADREWAANQVVRLFDWEVDSERAIRAWAGFLGWGHWYPELFDEMLPNVHQAFEHLDQLGQSKERFAAAMAGVAVYYPTDPWRNDGWLFRFIRAADVEMRNHWADALGDYSQQLNADAQAAVWELWLREYWHSRLTSVPHVLDERERQAMVLWVRGLRRVLPEAIAKVLAAPPTVLEATAFHQISQSRLAETEGPAIGTLLRGLLSRLNAVRWDHGEVAVLAFDALEHGASAEDIASVAEHMVRLNCRDADELRARAIRGGD